jgi:hypothetical protein
MDKAVGVCCTWHTDKAAPDCRTVDSKNGQKNSLRTPAISGRHPRDGVEQPPQQAQLSAQNVQLSRACCLPIVAPAGQIGHRKVFTDRSSPLVLISQEELGKDRCIG